MKTNPHQYATDWHQCRRCGCTRPTRALAHFGVVLDPVLRTVGDEYECKERELCERLKKGREDMRRREREAELLDIAAGEMRMAGKRGKKVPA